MGTERQLAQQMVNEQDKLIRLARTAAVRLVSPSLSVALREYRQGHDPISEILKKLDQLSDVIVDTMLASHLTGLRRATRMAPLNLSFKKTIALLRKRLKLSEREIQKLITQYSEEALRVVPKVKKAVDQSLQKTMTHITEEGMHVKEGVSALRQGFARAGLVPKSDFLLETVFRTQTQLAYSAGRWDQEQLPEIQEILWGYTYYTVGDDRVREEHAGFDGVTLPKEDPFWDANFPPNGWNCRCIAIAVYEERDEENPKAVDGVYPQASEGFDFHPGKMFRAIK